jgi:hypothetical protein
MYAKVSKLSAESITLLASRQITTQMKNTEPEDYRSPEPGELHASLGKQKAAKEGRKEATRRE